MRLLVLSSWWPFPADNGSRLRAYHLLRRLAKRHEISLIAFGTPGRDVLAPLQAFCARVIPVAPAVPPGRLGMRGLLSPVPRYHVQTESAEMRAHALALAPEHDAALGLQLGAARYLAELHHVPRVFEEAEVTAIRERCTGARPLPRRMRHGLTWWKARRFTAMVIDAVERTTVVSSIEREALVSMGCDASRIDVVPNGVEVTPSLAPRIAVQPARLIYPGSVQFDANLDAVRYFVHEVFPLIRQARPDATFWVTGATDGVVVTDLEQPGVTFTGRVPDVDRVVASSAACVVPLRAGGGTRLKVLQAMALGVPVVSTPKGVEGLDLEAERHVLIGRTPAQLAAHALRLLGDVREGERLAAAAFARAREQYNWDGIADSLERVIHEAIRLPSCHATLRTRRAGRTSPVY